MTVLFKLVPVAAPEASAIELVSLVRPGWFSVATLNEDDQLQTVDQFDSLEHALLRVAGLVKGHVTYRSVPGGSRHTNSSYSDHLWRARGI